MRIDAAWPHRVGIYEGGVAQLVRARGSYPRRPGFESLHRHHFDGGYVSETLENAACELLAVVGVPSVGDTLVVGLSGGPDSVALLDVLLNVGRSHDFSVVAAHLDHRLRPEASEDAAFCAELCQRLDVRLVTGSTDVLSHARTHRRGIEETAREERYVFLRDVKDRTGAVAIAVAHTLDDQAETFLLRLLRGAGRLGLSAMRPYQGDVLRPFLSVSREQILAHLRRRRLTWREDSSNKDCAFRRNRIRHELLPYLEARFNPRLRQALARTATQLAEEELLLGDLVDRLFEKLSRTEGMGIALSRKMLSQEARAMARLTLRSALARTGGLRGVTSAHVERLLELVRKPDSSGRWLPLPGGRRALVRFEELYIGPSSTKRDPFAVPLPVPGFVRVPGGLSLSARFHSREEEIIGPSCALIPLPENERLEVRTRRPGDRIICRGRNVSLKRYLMRYRVPADLRDELALVAAGDRVLWVPGLPGEPPEQGKRCVYVEARGLDAAEPAGLMKRRTA
jgi:tRNA(Ile)-lysidine synthase